MWLPYGIIVALATLIVDQASKYWLLHAYMLPDKAPVEMLPFLNLVATWNTGVSFGMLRDLGMDNKTLLIVLAIGICTALVVWLSRVTSVFLARAIGLVLGGAIANVIDRFRMGAVFDFIDLHAGGYHWPAFNIADSAICIGVGLIIIDSLWTTKDTSSPG